MAFETSEPPFLRHINGLRNGINRNGLNRGGFNVGGKKGFFHDIERRVDKLSTTQLVLLAAGGVSGCRSFDCAEGHVVRQQGLGEGLARRRAQGAPASATSPDPRDPAAHRREGHVTPARISKRAGNRGDDALRSVGSP